MLFPLSVGAFVGGASAALLFPFCIAAGAAVLAAGLAVWRWRSGRRVTAVAALALAGGVLAGLWALRAPAGVPPGAGDADAALVARVVRGPDPAGEKSRL